MTISSLLKKVLGVNGIVVEDVKFEATVSGEQMVVQGHATRHEQRRCPVCGRKCPLYDHGRGVRRWRALDMGNSMKVFIEADAPGSNAGSTAYWCSGYHGQGLGAVTPRASRKPLSGCVFIWQGKQ